MLNLDEEVPEVHTEKEEAEKEKEIPLKRKKKMAVSPSDLTKALTNEIAVKAVEQEHSKEIIVFQIFEKRRQQQILRDEAAIATTLQKETAMRKQTAEHCSFRSSPTITITTTEAGNFL